MSERCRFQQQHSGGFDRCLLTNDRLHIELIPELGGKLTSIRHLASGREWLWANPHLPLRPVEYDASFVTTFDTGGLDECFPAVSGGPYPAEPWAGSVIPDHGELWCQPWEMAIVESSDSRIILDMSCHGVRFPYRFERRLTLTAAAPHLQLDYRLTNLTPFDMPFIWSIHPILNLEEGMRLVLPEGIDTLHLDSEPSGFLAVDRSRVRWPLAQTGRGQIFDLARVPAADFGRAHKLYAGPLDPRMANPDTGQVETALTDPTGRHVLAFRFRPDEVTHIGLWLNYGGWSGSGSPPYFNLGLEPCIGGTDDLDRAYQKNEAAVLPARQTRTWSVEMWVT